MSEKKIRVVDLSEWTGPVSVNNARRMVNEYNIEGAILQAWGGGGVPGRRNEYFHQAVESFREVGITNLDPYVWPPRDWRAALDWIGESQRYMSGAVYLDVEAGAGVDDDIIRGVSRAGWEARIYASPSSWSQIMGNTTRYNHLKLWLARYLLRFQRRDGYYTPGFDVRFPEDALGGFVMGGWGVQDLVGWQTTGTVPNFAGESVDSNIFYRSAFRPEPEPIEEEEDDDMVDPRWDELILTYSGQPKQFDIMSGDGWRRGSLSRLEYLNYSALGWLNKRDPSQDQDHEHEVTGKAR